MRKPPKYCHHKRGRRDDDPGYWYFDRPGCARVRLPGLPWSPEFMAAYEAAAKGEPTVIVARKSSAEPGTLNDLIEKYLVSSAFLLGCKPGTRKLYRFVLDRIRRDAGNVSVAAIERKHIFQKLQKFVDTPSQGNLWLKIMSNLMHLAINLDMRGKNGTNPCLGIDKLPERKRETAPWSAEQRLAFEERWKIGTTQRLAYTLLLWTSRRLSDVRLLGPQHVQRIEGRDYIVFGQVKTGQPHASSIEPELAKVLAATKCGHLVFVTTDRGKPFASDGSFSHYMAAAIKEAGITGVTTHGLRATLPTDLAERGATLHELQAVTGHRQMSMVEKYTRKADQRQRASNALAKLGNGR